MDTQEHTQNLITSRVYQNETSLVDMSSMDDVIARVNDKSVRLLHHTMGIASEAGELTDAIKKHIFYGKPLDVENIIEECGDILWYMTRLLDVVGAYTLEDAMTFNNKKLKIRYSKGYSDKQAVERADKLEG